MNTETKQPLFKNAAIMTRLGFVGRAAMKKVIPLSFIVLLSALTAPEISAGEEVDEWLKAVRKETARYHSTTQALKAGYEPNPHCVAVPGLGGMGYHWLNPNGTEISMD